MRTSKETQLQCAYYDALAELSAAEKAYFGEGGTNHYSRLVYWESEVERLRSNLQLATKEAGGRYHNSPNVR